MRFRAVALRRSHPHAPAIDVLDLFMQHQHGKHPDPAALWLVPSADFGAVLAVAFDRSFTPDEWARWTQPPPDPGMIVGTLRHWRDAVLGAFAVR